MSSGVIRAGDQVVSPANPERGSGRVVELFDGFDGHTAIVAWCFGPNSLEAVATLRVASRHISSKGG